MYIVTDIATEVTVNVSNLSAFLRETGKRRQEYQIERGEDSTLPYFNVLKPLK